MTRLLRFLIALVVLLITTVAWARAGELRVCSDPDYMPFSNRAGQGFENKIASAVARDLGDDVSYTWDTMRGPGGFDQFLHDTLNAHKCDLVVDVPYASEDIATTKPYYVSSYVFVFLKKRGYDITSMDSPALRNLRIGYESETPAEDGLKIRALTPHGVPFDTSDSPGQSPAEILDAVASGRVAVAITWEPAVGFYLRSRPQFAVVAVPNSRSQGAPEQYAFPMAMAAREDDTKLRDRVNEVIQKHQAQLDAILADFGVRLYKATAVPGT